MKFLITLLGLGIAAFALDINTATVDEFKGLKGVGQAKAEKIVTYRESVKCFENIEQLKLVAGIGENIFKDNQSMLTASPCDKTKVK